MSKPETRQDLVHIRRLAEKVANNLRVQMFKEIQSIPHDKHYLDVVKNSIAFFCVDAMVRNYLVLEHIYLEQGYTSSKTREEYIQEVTKTIRDGFIQMLKRRDDQKKKEPSKEQMQHLLNLMVMDMDPENDTPNKKRIN